jgi:hypothetical protein
MRKLQGDDALGLEEPDHARHEVVEIGHLG